MRRSRGGAQEPNERKPENGSRAPSSRSILMTNTLKDWKFFTVPESVFIMTWSPEVKLGSNRRIRVKSGRLVGIYQIYICFDSEFSQEFKFNIFQGQLGSSEAKLGSNPAKRGQIEPVGRNILKIHMFRLRISSAIEI